MMFTIDQNCHTLWDVVPKLHALIGRGVKVHHFIEDLDVAFAAPGAAVGDQELRLAKERFHRSGGADWGAAIFYSEFLGRLPVEIREWEALTGLKTGALARQLGRSVDDLYDEFSPGDNWQLIGSSYVGDRDHHRLIGDLSVAEVADFLQETFAKARADMLSAFPSKDSQDRLKEWLTVEQRRLSRLLREHSQARLVDLYGQWMREVLGDSVRLDLLSSLFDCAAEGVGTELAEVFLTDYDLAAGLYNEAIDEASVGLRPLRVKDGELPFFATLEHQGRLVRTSVYLRDGGIAVGDRLVPLADGRRMPVGRLRAAGVRCLVGKAALLVLQVRSGPRGRALALPYRGSLYMPAAHLLAEKLSKAGLLRGGLKPLLRVRFCLLDRMRSIKTPIRLPEHLAACFGRQEIPAYLLGEDYRELARQATERLEMFADPDGRRRWQRQEFADQFARVDQLDLRRRDLASSDPKGPEIRAVWQQIKSLQVDILDATVRRISREYQISRIDYWDSRGALWPWCIGLGGQKFYREVVERAQVYEEPAEAGRSREVRKDIREHYEPRLITRRENYQIVDWGSAESQQERFEVLAANVDLAGKRLLDIGCGLGDLWEFLRRRCITTHYTGVDLLEPMVRAAGRRHPEARFVCADVFAEDAFRPGEFEVVFCSGALNLNLGNNDAFVPLAVARMLELSRDYAVFNLLHKRTTDRDRRYFYYDPEDVARSLAPLECRIDILDDYLPNDFTVICRKEA